MRSQEQQVKANDRQKQALELRKAGVSYAAIAKTLRYKNPSGAHEAVKAALKKTLQEPAAEVRELELERLDAMLRAIWPQVVQGNQGAIDRALRIQERRARLLGLDAPTKIETRNEDVSKLSDEELNAIVSAPT